MANDENLSKTKLKISYVHNGSSQSFLYATIAQTFDEIAAQNPDFECFVFKGIVSNSLALVYSFYICLSISRGKQTVHIQNIST